MTIVPAPGWEELGAFLEGERGAVLLLGTTDTGKSTFARHLVALLSCASPVALVDADVGQSSLCMPGTVGSRIFRPATATPYACDTLSFLGSASPANVLLPLVRTTARFVERCRAAAPLVIVDTTGLVAGEFGLRLKLLKIAAVRPAHVVAIQRREECEPILTPLRDVVVHRLTPSPHVHPRNQEERRRRRQERLAAYFAGEMVAERFLPVEKVTIMRFGEPIALSHQEVPGGTVVGLFHGEECLGLGCLVEADRDAMTVLTPAGDLKRVNRVVYGDVVLEGDPP